MQPHSARSRNRSRSRSRDRYVRKRRSRSRSRSYDRKDRRRSKRSRSRSLESRRRSRSLERRNKRSDGYGYRQDQRTVVKKEFDKEEKEEEEFHKSQAKLRSKIRIKEGRATPFDRLAKLPLFMDSLENNAIPHFSDVQVEILVENTDPWQMISSFGESELEQLQKDVHEHLHLKLDVQYWESVLKIVDHILLNSKQSAKQKLYVQKEVEDFMKSKSVSELDSLKRQVQALLNNDYSQSNVLVDIDFWTRILREMDVFVSRTFAMDLYSKCLAIQQEKKPSSVDEKPDTRDSYAKIEESNRFEESSSLATDPSKSDASAIDSLLASAFSQEESEDDALKFADEVELPQKTDNEMLIRPRYDNRAFYGYEWTRYNQAHYEKGNPPPKVVKGYRFRIFYPELTDAKRAPKFTLHDDPRYPDKEFCILKFSAGAPYQDLGFKIVNRDWETSHRNGFLCKFDRGVLYLYFRFKKYKYKR